MNNSPVSSSTMPQGIYFSWMPMAWSLARWFPLVLPPREDSPKLTVALQARLMRLAPFLCPCSFLRARVSKIRSVSGNFFGAWL